MPTIIDSLIVQLGLDSKKFKSEQERVNRGLKDTGNEAKKTGDKLNQAGKDGAKGFKESSDGLSKLMTLMAAGYVFKRFIVDITQTNAEIYRFSRNLQQNAKDISAWGNAVEITGGDARQFRGTLSMLSKAQTELQMTGQSGLIPYFSRFNVAMMDVNGNARKGTDILLDLADRMQGMDRTTAYNTLQAMGIDEGTANAMLEGRKSLQALIDKQKEHGALTNEQAKRAEDTRRSMKEAELATRAAKNEMADGLNPVIRELLDLFNKLDVATNGWSTSLVTLAGALLGLRTAAGVIRSIIGGGAAGAATGGAASGGASILSRIGAALSPIFRIGGVGAALGLYSGNLNEGEDEKMRQIHAMQDAMKKKGDDRSAFIAAASAELGVPPSAIDAQLRLETGAQGKSAIGKFNYGNIKAGKGWMGDRVSRNVLEYDKNGNPLTESSAFRSYKDATQAGKDYAAVIKRRFPGAVGASNARDFAAGLKSGGYATDPLYVDKITRIAGGIPSASSSVGSGARGSTTLSIGEVKVYTQATDANGIARDFRAALNTQMQNQANTGLN